MAHSVTSADIRQGLACFYSRQCFSNLKWSEFRFAPEPHASGLCSLAAFTCPRKDQGPLELSETTKDSEHQSTVRSLEAPASNGRSTC
jgi:hypothetical protein